MSPKEFLDAVTHPTWERQLRAQDVHSEVRVPFWQAVAIAAAFTWICAGVAALLGVAWFDVLKGAAIIFPVTFLAAFLWRIAAYRDTIVTHEREYNGTPNGDSLPVGWHPVEVRPYAPDRLPALTPGRAAAARFREFVEVAYYVIEQEHVNPSVARMGMEGFKSGECTKFRGILVERGMAEKIGKGDNDPWRFVQGLTRDDALARIDKWGDWIGGRPQGREQ